MADTLDIALLRTVVAIDDCGGFGRAAAALQLSQPTVSQHVRALEQRLGRPLVEKSGRNAKFTDAGERLLVQARRIIAVHDDALRRLNTAQARPLVIGSTETAAEQVLPGLLTALREAYPERPVQFQIDRSTQMTDAVAKGTIDLAVVLETEPAARGIGVGVLPLRWYAAVGWGLPAPDRPLPLVAYIEPCGMRSRALRLLEQSGRQIEVSAESGSLEGVLAAARAGLGVAVLPSVRRQPAGLVERDDLPDLGHIFVRLVGRRGLDAEVERTAAVALEQFFSRGAPTALSA